MAAGKNGGAIDEPFAIYLCVGRPGDGELAEVAEADDAFSLLADLCENVEEDSHKQGDDGDDDEKLDKRKGGFVCCINEIFAISHSEHYNRKYRISKRRKMHLISENT